VAEDVEHNIVGLLVAFTERVATFTVKVVVLEHPVAATPVTEYVSVTVGETTTLLPVSVPGIQV
jgi:hypothetical protein